MVVKKLSDLVPNEYNPREIFRGASMEELKNSMADVGLIHPILVRPIDNGKFEVVAGMRRYYAAKDLEWESIECHIRKLSDFDAILMAYTENVQREDLTPIEQGKMYGNLKDVLIKKAKENGNFDNVKKPMEKIWTQMEETIKLSHVQMRKYISLLDLPKELQNLLENKNMPTVYGFELARLPQEQMLSFYERYYKNPDLRLAIENFKKQVSQQLRENKLEGEKLRETLELRLKKVEMEIESFNSSSDAFGVKIEEILEAMQSEYNQEFDEESAIKFLMEKMDEFQSQKGLGTIAKELKVFEHQVDDLDVLLERVKTEEFLNICPYCLAKIDIPIINKRRGIFTEEIDKLNNELFEINSKAEFIRESLRDLEDYLERIKEKSMEIELKEKELEEINGELRAL